MLKKLTWAKASKYKKNKLVFGNISIAFLIYLQPLVIVYKHSLENILQYLNTFYSSI
jgi:hypothetical protein